jgi:hypothetical protein
VVVFKVQIADFVDVAINPGCEPPILGDMKAPGSLSIAGQAMRLPYRDGFKFVLLIHFL